MHVDPARHDVREVAVDQRIPVQAKLRARLGKSVLELAVPPVQEASAWQNHGSGMVARKEVAYLLDHALHSASVLANVLPGDIGDELLVPVPLRIQNDAGLAALLAASERLRSREDPQLERHVEARQPAFAVQLRPRDVMDRQPALADDLVIFWMRTCELSSTSSAHRG